MELSNSSSRIDEHLMEVDPGLVPGAVFKTVGPYGSMRLVGSIPMHFRHFDQVAVIFLR